MEIPMLWLSWEKHVRNKTLSSRLGAVLVEIEIETSVRVIRYLLSSIQTVRLLWRWRGRLVVTQNPSIVLSLLGVLLKPFLGYRLLIDAHNAGIYPAEGNSPFLSALSNFIIKHANGVIVTNKILAHRVSELGGFPIELPDPLPQLTPTPKPQQKPSPKVLFICTWAIDEPYFEVFKAAELLPTHNFIVTGRSKGRERGYGKPIPPNVKLAGFIPDTEYHQCLVESDVILDLTTRENCLVCGAYEAIAAGTPFVLSDTKAIKSYFRKGGVYVDNTGPSIATGIEIVLRDYTRYLDDINEFKHTLNTEWQESLTHFWTSVAHLNRS